MPMRAGQSPVSAGTRKSIAETPSRRCGTSCRAMPGGRCWASRNTCCRRPRCRSAGSSARMKTTLGRAGAAAARVRAAAARKDSPEWLHVLPIVDRPPGLSTRFVQDGREACPTNLHDFRRRATMDSALRDPLRGPTAAAQPRFAVMAVLCLRSAWAPPRRYHRRGCFLFRPLPYRNPGSWSGSIRVPHVSGRRAAALSGLSSRVWEMKRRWSYERLTPGKWAP
jgi:hypothetical protein